MPTFSSGCISTRIGGIKHCAIQSIQYLKNGNLVLELFEKVGYVIEVVDTLPAMYGGDKLAECLNYETTQYENYGISDFSLSKLFGFDIIVHGGVNYYKSNLRRILWQAGNGDKRTIMTNRGDTLIFEVIQKYPRKDSCLALAMQSAGTGRGFLMDYHYNLDSYDLESVLYLNTDYIESILVDEDQFDYQMKNFYESEGFY